MYKEDESSMQEKERYINGIKRLQDHGVKVLVGGRVPGYRDWNNLLHTREDGAFYMCDFVNDESGKLQEVHFDLVRQDPMQTSYEEKTYETKKRSNSYHGYGRK